MAQQPLQTEQVTALRAFNRFYTRRIGVLDERLYGTPFTLPQTRVLWELAHHEGISATELAKALDLDAGYLSRLLAALKARKLVRAQRSPADARQSMLSLTAAGRRAFEPMNAHSQAQTAALLSSLDEPNRRRLLQAAGTIEALLGAPRADRPPYLLRAPRPGDMGWVVARHGAIYAQEYGWDITFEGLVAQIVGHFIEHFDAKREACWIAERDGQNVGCVFLVQARDDKTGKPERGAAQLRLLIVEPGARGLGIGARLVAECERFARDAGYKRIKLWTQSSLTAARAIYAKAGYQLGQQRAAPQLRYGPDRRDVGDGAVAAAAAGASGEFLAHRLRVQARDDPRQQQAGANAQRHGSHTRGGGEATEHTGGFTRQRRLAQRVIDQRLQQLLLQPEPGQVGDDGQRDHHHERAARPLQAQQQAGGRHERADRQRQCQC